MERVRKLRSAPLFLPLYNKVRLDETRNKNSIKLKSRNRKSRAIRSKRRQNKMKETKDKSLSGIILEYCKNTSIHGFQYLGETDRPVYERCFWVLMIIFSAMGCGWFIFSLYEKYQTSPIVVSISEKTTPVWEIPFPAITICPETKANKKIFNYTDALDRLAKVTNQRVFYKFLDDFELDAMQMMLQICDETHAIHDFILHCNYSIPLCKDPDPILWANATLDPIESHIESDPYKNATYDPKQ